MPVVCSGWMIVWSWDEYPWEVVKKIQNHRPKREVVERAMVRIYTQTSNLLFKHYQRYHIVRVCFYKQYFASSKTMKSAIIYLMYTGVRPGRTYWNKTPQILSLYLFTYTFQTNRGTLYKATRKTFFFFLSVPIHILWYLTRSCRISSTLCVRARLR